ncbi:MAG: PilZ domain-containing protein [Hyphomicrobiaceae bacterium]
MTPSFEHETFQVSQERLKQTQFELASMAFEARGGGRESYNRSSLLSLLIVLQHEIERSLILSSIVASAANGIEASVANIKPRTLIQYFPNESSQLTLASMRLNKWFGDIEICKLLDRFKQEQALAIEQTIAFVATGFSQMQVDEQGRSELAMGWQRVCSVGGDLLNDIDRELAEYDIQGAAIEVSELCELLKAVGAGKWPMLNEQGEVIMPNWAEQREFPRVLVRSPATLECRGKEQRVILRDVSTTGIGLQSVKQLKEGDCVVVKTNKGLTLKGKVVWAQYDRAGVVLSRPLHSDDPSLKFLSMVNEETAGEFSNA